MPPASLSTAIPMVDLHAAVQIACSGMHGCMLGCINHTPSAESTALPTKMAGDLAMKSGCSRCNGRRPRHYNRRHRHHDRRHTSPAIVLHMARLRLESTKCSSSGCYHVRWPIKWVDNLASHTSSGGMSKCRLERWHRGRLRAIPAIVLHMARNRLESMKCSSSG